MKSLRGWRSRILWILAFTVNLPLLWTFLASFGIIPDNMSRPPVWIFPGTLENYRQVVTDPNLAHELLTSIVIAILTAVLTTAIAFLAAYSLARAGFRGRGLLVQGLLVLSIFPVISYITPLKDTMLFFHLYDTLPGIVLPETALYAPLAVYVLFSFLSNMPLELEQAAYLDGASLRQVLTRIVGPIAKSAIVAMAVIVFVLSWNQLLMPMVITSRHVQTIPVMLSDFFTYERELEWETAAVALVVSLLPLLIFIGVAHRALEGFSLQAAYNAEVID